MKALSLAFLLTGLVFSSCTLMQQVDTGESLIDSYRPEFHEGCVKSGRYGEYSYNIYPHSIEVLALSPHIPIGYAEIWDVDKDGRFDSVWIQDHGKWRFSSQKSHPVLTNDPDSLILTNWLGFANILRNLENGIPKGIPPHQEEE